MRFPLLTRVRGLGTQPGSIDVPVETVSPPFTNDMIACPRTGVYGAARARDALFRPVRTGPGASRRRPGPGIWIASGRFPVQARPAQVPVEGGQRNPVG